MSSMAVFSDTDVKQAKLLSHLSGRPAKVKDDIFIWNGYLIDRATAVVALLKVNNQVPVGDSVKIRLHQAYDRKFAVYQDSAECVSIENDDIGMAARIWFNMVCRNVKGQAEQLSSDVVQQILVDLHS